MTQRELCEIIARHRGDAALVFGAGTASYDFYGIASGEKALFQMDLGYATPIALGLALGDADHRVVSIEGDGAVIAGMAGLSTVGRLSPSNLVIIVPDNETYAAIQDPNYPPIESSTRTTLDLEGVARACGLSRTETVSTSEEADAAVRQAMTEGGPWFIVAKVIHDAETPPWEPQDPAFRAEKYIPDVFDNALTFAREMRQRSRAWKTRAAETSAPTADD